MLLSSHIQSRTWYTYGVLPNALLCSCSGMDKNNLAESESEAQMQNQQNRDQQYAVRGHRAQDRHGHLSVDSATYKTDSTGAYHRQRVERLEEYLPLFV